MAAISESKKLYSQLLSYAESLRNHSSPRDFLILDDIHQVMKDPRIALNYISSGGEFQNFKLSNTCVLDSLLTGLHLTSKTNEHIRDIFLVDNTIRPVITLLDYKKFDMAKILWILNLEIDYDGKKSFFEGEFINVQSNISDHLRNFQHLKCASLYFDDQRLSPPPEDRSSCILKKTLRKFENYGDVLALGNTHNPVMILIHVDGRLQDITPLSISDIYGRTFELQFLLLGIMTKESNHMVLCIKLDRGWLLYDDLNSSLFQHVDINDVRSYTKTGAWVVYLAAYAYLESR